MAGNTESPEFGESIQVVKQERRQHSFCLDEDLLKSVLLRDDIKERSVVIISVAGAFRQGKSFLLGFILRYLHYKYILGRTDEKWLGSKTEPLRGFSWRGGAERDTTGLLLWSQPFKATLEDGEKVVIFLMDTQGTFDSESIVQDCATVFALSTMLSSVQIFNLSQNIKEDDLQHLQLFTEYGRLAVQADGELATQTNGRLATQTNGRLAAQANGRLAAQTNGRLAAQANGRLAAQTNGRLAAQANGRLTAQDNGRPFQRLQFLVRDWSYPYEYGYGADGGRRLLARRLEVREGQHPELQALRRDIAESFEELACFLMPHPGRVVATDPDFNGSLAAIDPEFQASLLELVPMLLAPQNLVPKRIQGQTVRAQDMVHYFKAYMNIFRGNRLPKPMTMLKATAEAHNLSAVSEAKDAYDIDMEEVCGVFQPHLEPERLEEEHVRVMNEALEAFRRKPKMGGEKHALQYEADLKRELETKFVKLCSQNRSKSWFARVGTPVLLLAVVLVCYVLNALGAALGVETLVDVGQLVAIIASGILTLWGYSRATGSLFDLIMRIDKIALVILDYLWRAALRNRAGEFVQQRQPPRGRRQPQRQHQE